MEVEGRGLFTAKFPGQPRKGGDLKAKHSNWLLITDNLGRSVYNVKQYLAALHRASP